jgi:hypothetical protein
METLSNKIVDLKYKKVKDIHDTIESWEDRWDYRNDCHYTKDLPSTRTRCITYEVSAVLHYVESYSSPEEWIIDTINNAEEYVELNEIIDSLSSDYKWETSIVNGTLKTSLLVPDNTRLVEFSCFIECYGEEIPQDGY